MTVKFNRTMKVGLPLAAMSVAAAAWMFFPDETHSRTDAVSLNLATLDESDDPPSATPAAAPATANIAPMGRLSLSGQSFRRGGLGSKALMTFTVRNANKYAVKDIELLCKFSSPDGSYATERRRTIADTIEMRSRKAFPLTHIGFVNVKASKAKCAVVTAERA